MLRENRSWQVAGAALVALSLLTPALGQESVAAGAPGAKAATAAAARRAAPARASRAQGTLQAPALSPFVVPSPLLRTLDNGLRVAVFPNSRLGLVQIQVRVPAGVEAEDPKQGGLAYMTSQMLHLGTTSRDQKTFAADLDRLGGTLTATASRDFATVSGAFLSRDFESGLELVSDAVVNPIFTEDDLHQLKAQAQRSLNQMHQNPATLAEEQVWSLAFGAHPYGRPPFGTLESVDALTRDEVREFHRDHYRPDGTLLLIGGDVTTERAFAAAQEWFGRWAGKCVPSTSPPAPEAPRTPHIRIVDNPTASATELRLGFVLPGKTSPDELPLSLVAAMIGGGPASLFQSPAFKQRVGHDAHGAILMLRDGGLFSCGAVVRTDSAAAAIAFLRSQLSRFVAEPPASAALAAVQRVSANTFPMSLETLGGLIGQWLYMDYLGLGSDAMNRIPERIAAVRPAEVAAAALRWIDPARVAIVAVGPAEQLQRQFEALGPVEVVHVETAATALAHADTVEATPERVQHGRRVIDQALAAHGGREKLEGIHDSVIEADLSLMSQGRELSGPMTQVRKEPFKMVYHSKFEMIESTQILNGNVAWSVTGSEAAAEDVDSLGLMGLRIGFRSDLPHVLLDAAAPLSRVVYHGDDRVERTDVEGLDVVLPDGNRERLYFDLQTHRLVTLDELATSPNGTPVTSRRVFRDLRDAQGILWPFSEDRLLDGEPAMKLRIKSVKINVGVDDKLFGKPPPPSKEH